MTWGLPHNARMMTHHSAGDRTAARLLKLGEAATWLSCSRRYLDELIKKRRLPAVRLDPDSPKTARVRVDDLRAFCTSLPTHTVGAA